MRRVLPLLVVGPFLTVAGFYTATFAYALIAQLLSFAASLGWIGLYFLGLVSSQNDLGTAPARRLAVRRDATWRMANAARGLCRGAAQRDLSLSVAEIAQGDSKANGCVTEVEGVLVYAERPRRLELHPEGAGTPSIRVYFFLGDRTLFGASGPRLPPRYYDQVSEFVGKRVRIVGTAAPGQVRADIGHIVLADAHSPRIR